MAIKLRERLAFAAFAAIRDSATYRCFATQYFGSVIPSVCSLPFIKSGFIELNFARTRVAEPAVEMAAVVAGLGAVRARAGFIDSRSSTTASFGCPVSGPSCWLG